jgi:membrane-bound ClpP family serine protease
MARSRKHATTQRDGHRRSRRVVIRYALLQVPATVLVIVVLALLETWFRMEKWVFWAALAAWVAKDAFLFPLVWRAYDREGTEQAKSMIGLCGTATERLAPIGYIQVRGELWRARAMDEGDSIEKGESVEVVNVDGLTLHVVHIPKDKEAGL